MEILARQNWSAADKVKMKIKQFVNTGWIDSIQDDASERCFRFFQDGKEALSLTLTDLKCLPDLAKHFTIAERDVGAIWTTMCLY